MAAIIDVVALVVLAVLLIVALVTLWVTVSMARDDLAERRRWRNGGKEEA